MLNQTASGRAPRLRCAVGRDPRHGPGALADDSRYVREAVLGRLMQATHRGERSGLAAAGRKSPRSIAKPWRSAMTTSPLSAPAPAPLAFWTRAYGAWGNFNGDGNAATADRDLGGFVSGMDAQLSARGGRASPPAPHSPMSMWTRGIRPPTWRATLSAAISAAWRAPLPYAVAACGPGAISTRSRAVVFPGFFERQKASYDADTGQLFGEVAYPTQMMGMALEPFGGLAYVSIDTRQLQGAWRGAGVLARLADDQDVGYSTWASAPPRR